MDPSIDIINPLNPPETTDVLDVGGKYYISAQGDMRHGGARYLTRAWAKVYVTELLPNNPTQNSPYNHDSSALEGYVEPVSRDFYFLGSETTFDPTHSSKLIEVADPVLYPTQHLYIWGLASDNKNAEPDHVTMALVIAHRTNAGDTEL